MTMPDKFHFELLLKITGDLIMQRISEIQEQKVRVDGAAVNNALQINAGQVQHISQQLGVRLKPEEEFICFLALIPYLSPGFFDNVITRIFPQGAEIPEIGGVKGTAHRGFIPTGETALFLLAGNSLHARLSLIQLFDQDHVLSKHDILHLEPVNHGEPYLSGKLILSDESINKLLFGTPGIQRFNSGFPAKYVTTNLNWDDLVINPSTLLEIETIKNWLAHHETMSASWNLKDKFKPGYKALFYGSPGTGKTFTATLLGKHFQKEVYRIDLSQVVSKYIGETEKNLEKIFQKAGNKDWILFFDEADALFGKRTSVSSAHDRYANQETSYLLQRIEDFSGLVILASNNKTNIDSAFLRRFNAVVHFPQPDVAERLNLWQIYLPSNHALTHSDLKEISSKFEVTGATILNAVHHAALNAFGNNSLISKENLTESVKREYRKEDRMPV